MNYFNQQNLKILSVSQISDIRYQKVTDFIFRQKILVSSLKPVIRKLHILAIDTWVMVINFSTSNKFARQLQHSASLSSGEYGFKTKQTASYGFTLVETMVVLVILSVLTAIAIPAYSDYIKERDRNGAKLALIEANEYVKRYQHNNDAIPTKLPNELKNYPKKDTTFYNIGFKKNSINQNENTYTLVAVPVNKMKADECGVFGIDQRGVKFNTNGKLVQKCWGSMY